jgi:hypothetical protein
LNRGRHVSLYSKQRDIHDADKESETLPRLRPFSLSTIETATGASTYAHAAEKKAALGCVENPPTARPWRISASAPRPPGSAPAADGASATRKTKVAVACETCRLRRVKVSVLFTLPVASGSGS